MFMGSVVQQDLQDDASADRYQQVVAAALYPMVAAWRGRQLVATPVVHHILAAAVLGGQPSAPVERVVGPGAALIWLRLVLRHRVGRCTVKLVVARLLRWLLGALAYLMGHLPLGWARAVVRCIAAVRLILRSAWLRAVALRQGAAADGQSQRQS